MVAEHVETFILRLIIKTKGGKLKWKIVDKIDKWEKIKRQIEKEIDLKGYFINESKSYGIQVFSKTLKLFLATKIIGCRKFYWDGCWNMNFETVSSFV